MPIAQVVKYFFDRSSEVIAVFAGYKSIADIGGDTSG
jgi:hypothetical protein